MMFSEAFAQTPPADIAAIIAVIAGVVILGQKLTEYAIERVKLARAKRGDAPTREASDHPLQPQLKALAEGQAGIESSLGKINKTLNGNGDPRGGLVTMVNQNTIRIDHLERDKH